LQGPVNLKIELNKLEMKTRDGFLGQTVRILRRFQLFLFKNTLVGGDT